MSDSGKATHSDTELEKEAVEEKAVEAEKADETADTEEEVLAEALDKEEGAESETVKSEKKTQKKAGSTSTKPSFWKGVKTEFKKIVWPKKNTLVKQSSAVIIVSVIIGAIIAVIDRAVLYGIDFLLK